MTETVRDKTHWSKSRGWKDSAVELGMGVSSLFSGSLAWLCGPSKEKLLWTLRLSTRVGFWVELCEGNRTGDAVAGRGFRLIEFGEGKATAGLWARKEAKEGMTMLEREILRRADAVVVAVWDRMEDEPTESGGVGGGSCAAPNGGRLCVCILLDRRPHKRYIWADTVRAGAEVI